VTGFGSLIFASCRTDWLIRGVLPMLPGHLRVIPIAVTTWPDALIARRPAQLSFMPARDGPGDGLFPSLATLFDLAQILFVFLVAELGEQQHVADLARGEPEFSDQTERFVDAPQKNSKLMSRAPTSDACGHRRQGSV